MSILVLIPTYKKTIDDIKNLYKFLNLKTNAIFANQCGENKILELDIDGKNVKVICTDKIGVSVNRNLLLTCATADYNLFIDDDCPLVDDYADKVQAFYTKNNANSCVFNGIWSTHNGKLVHYKKTSKIKRFNQISYAGGPGFTCTKDFTKFNKVKFNEQVGTPNYICAGEDSLFYHDLVKAKTNLYRSSEVLFNVAIDETNSSYFEGIDERYVITRGYITKKIHSKLFCIYEYRHIFRFKKQGSKLSIKEMLKCMKKGAKMYKEENKK